MKAFTLIGLLFFIFSAISQDERYYRKFFTGELIDKSKNTEKYKVTVESPRYEVDLNQDKAMESIRVQKRDGIDFFIIYDQNGYQIFNKKLNSIGLKSKLVKVELKSISPSVNTLILHFYEGAINSTKFESMASLYFVTINKRNIRKIHFSDGPHFFHEKEVGEKYLNRRYTVNTIDYNKDGIREISISYNKIQRIYFYLNNDWIKF